VTGRAQDGIGVLAKSGNGTALKVEGPVDLSRSGRTTVAAGQRYSQIPLGDLSSKTFIIATVQGGTGGVWVQRVAVSPTHGYIRIYLNAAVAANTTVGWFAID
jgi:hypothetical protein